MKKVVKKMVRALALLCSVALLLEAGPVISLAEAAMEEAALSVSAGENEIFETEGGSRLSYLIGEAAGEREEAVKHFRRSDGTTVAAVYSEPIHYEENGEWRDIDNTLVSAEPRNGVAYVENRANDFRVALPSGMAAGRPVELAYQGHTLRFHMDFGIRTRSGVADAREGILRQPDTGGAARIRALQDSFREAAGLKAEEEQALSVPMEETAAASSANVLETPDMRAEEETALQARAETLTPEEEETVRNLAEEIEREVTTLRMASAGITYADLMPGTDLLYDVTGKSLKESLVLDALPGTASYTFLLECATLTAVLNSDRSVTLADAAGEAVLVIEAPYMWDAAGEESSDIAVSLEEAPGGYRYTITPDREWLAAAERLYPVTVDPTMSAPNNWSTIKDTTGVYNSSMGTLNTTAEKKTIKVGNRQGSEVVGLVYQPMPSLLNDTSRIIEASLVLCQRADGSPTCSGGVQINAHRITGDWNTGNIQENGVLTHSSIPGWSGTALDYQMISDASAPSNPWVKFDITKAAQQWMEGEPNYGILLSGANLPALSQSCFARFYDSDNGPVGGVEIAPTFLYAYRDTKGTESYWTSHEQAVGRAGTGIVNDFSGRLVFVHQDAATPGNRLPASVSHVYNALQAGEDFSKDSAAVAAGGSGVPAYPKTGLGWKLDIQQTAVAIPESSDPNSLYQLLQETYQYIYTDADGTEHYFFERNGQYVDEDGLNLRMYSQSGGMRLNAADGSFMEFDTAGELTAMQDKEGNRREITYATYNGMKYIQKITDGAGQALTLHIDNSGYLDYIEDTAGRRTTYYYDASRRLTRIAYPDGTSSYYRYDSGNRLSEVESGRVVMRYSYDSRGRVIKVLKTTSGTQNGVALGISYPDYSTTEFRNAGGDDVYGNADDLLTTYQFNNYGQTVGTATRDLNGVYMGGGRYTYSKGSYLDSGDSMPNRLQKDVASDKPVINLLPNTSMENGQSPWGSWVWETQGRDTFTRDTTRGYSGSSSLKISKTGNAGSKAYWCYENAAMFEPGKSYTASVYAYAPSLNGNSVHIGLWCPNPDGSGTVVYSEPLSMNTVDGWERLSVTIDVPADAGTTFGCVYFFYNGQNTGEVWFDCAQLEEGTAANGYNLLENGDLEKGSGNGFDSWNAQGSYEQAWAVSGDAATGRMVRLNGQRTSRSQLSQTVQVGGEKRDTYVLGMWGKGSAVKRGGTFGAEITIHYTSGGDKTLTQQFELEATGWQYLTYGFNLDDGSRNSRRPVSVTIKLVYENQLNGAYIDSVQLVKEPFPSYTYDKNGNLISAVDNARSQEFTSDNKNQLTRMTDPSGNFMYYDYAVDTGRMEWAVTTNGVEYSFDYDEYGNATGVRVNAREFTSIGTITIRNRKTGQFLFAAGLPEQTEATLMMTNRDKEMNGVWTNDQFQMQYFSKGYRIKSVAHQGYIYSNCPGTFLRVIKNSAPSFGEFLLEFGDYTTSQGAYCRIKHESSGKYITYDEAHGWVTLMEGDEDNAAQYWLPQKVEEASARSLVSGAEYSADGRYLTDVTDTRGYVTSYEYDETRGVQTRVTSGKESKTDATGGRTVNYTYNAQNDLLTGVSQQNGTGTAQVGYTYDGTNALSSIQHNGFEYRFSYNPYGQAHQVRVGEPEGGRNVLLSTSTYLQNGAGKLSRMSYGNGDWYVDYGYDALSRLTRQSYNGVTAFEWGYNNKGQTAWEKDHANGRETRYGYDTLGRMSEWWNTSGARGSYRYDENNSLLKWRYGAFGLTAEQENTYRRNLLTKSTVGGVTVNYTYDALTRVSEKKVGVQTTTYDYLPVLGTSNRTTTFLNHMNVYGANKVIDYAYIPDRYGNIVQYRDFGNLKATYTYDELNQLVREDNMYSGKSVVYEYDGGGNIVTKKEYGYTTGALGEVQKTVSYGYDEVWKDLLKSYDGQAIAYDWVKNPLTWRDGLSFTWSNGRQLTGATKDGTALSFGYNSDGLRLHKTVGTSRTDYEWDGSALLAEQTGNNKILYLYDGTGLIGFKRNGVTYTYVYNGLGDVMEILDKDGNAVVSYLYDAWGAPISITGPMASTLGAQNPIRYRGYYYDTETGLYYLQSRYYDPVVGRFLNADGLLGANGDLMSYNLFAYCSNNPVNMSDPTGKCAICKLEMERQFQLKLRGMVRSIEQPSVPSPPSSPAPAPTKSVGEKIVDTVQAIASSIETEAGVGIGLKGNVDIAGIGVDVGVKQDLFQAKIVDGNFDLGYGFDASFMATVGPYDLGPHVSQFGSHLSNIIYPEEYSNLQNTGVIEIFGAEAYVLYGFNYSIGFNYKTFSKKWDEIWN